MLITFSSDVSAVRTLLTFPNFLLRQRINNLKTKLDPMGMYMKRQNGGAFTHAPGYMFPSNQYGGGKYTSTVY
jgi:hypothetical protein